MTQHHKIWQSIAAVLFFVIVVGSAIFLLKSSAFTDTIKAAGYWGPVVLILLKISTVVIAPLDGTPLYLVAPALFGFWPAFIYILIADIIGCSAAFWISRLYGRAMMNFMLSDKQLAWIDKTLVYIGDWKKLALARVIFYQFADVITYAAGLTKISFVSYFWSTFVLLIINQIILNNIGAHFVKNPTSLIIVLGVTMSVAALLVLLVKKFKPKVL